MKKKLLICSIILAFVAAASIACSKTETQEKETVVQPLENETEVLNEEFYTSDLSTERYDGYKYRILTRKGYSASQCPEELTGDVVNDALYRRNEDVEERFGIEIICTESLLKAIPIQQL